MLLSYPLHWIGHEGLQKRPPSSVKALESRQLLGYQSDMQWAMQGRAAQRLMFCLISFCIPPQNSCFTSVNIFFLFSSSLATRDIYRSCTSAYFSFVYSVFLFSIFLPETTCFFSPFNTHFWSNKATTCPLRKGKEGYRGEMGKSNGEGSWVPLLRSSYLCSQSFCFWSPTSPGGSAPHPAQMAVPAGALPQCCCAANCRKSSHKSPTPCPADVEAACSLWMEASTCTWKTPWRWASWAPVHLPWYDYGQTNSCLLPLHTKSSSKFLLITVILKCLVSFKFWVIWMQRVAARFLSFQKASFPEAHYIKTPPYKFPSVQHSAPC